MEKKGVLLLVILTVVIILLCGCTNQSTHLDMKVNMTADESDLLKNPVPFSVRIEAENTGSADAKNVSADIMILYQDKIIKTQTVNFGDIKAGEFITREEVILAPFPDGHPVITGDALNLGIDNIYANGKKQTDVTIT